MANGDTYFEGTIERVERLNNSRNGNPRFRLHLADGRTLETQADAPWSYEATNSENRGTKLIFTVTRGGRVSHAENAAALINEAADAGNHSGSIHGRYALAYKPRDLRKAPRVPDRFKSVSVWYLSAYADGIEEAIEADRELG